MLPLGCHFRCFSSSLTFCSLEWVLPLSVAFCFLGVCVFLEILHLRAFSVAIFA